MEDKNYTKTLSYDEVAKYIFNYLETQIDRVEKYVFDDIKKQLPEVIGANKPLEVTMNTSRENTSISLSIDDIVYIIKNAAADKNCEITNVSIDKKITIDFRINRNLSKDNKADVKIGITTEGKMPYSELRDIVMDYLTSSYTEEYIPKPGDQYFKEKLLETRQFDGVFEIPNTVGDFKGIYTFDVTREQVEDIFENYMARKGKDVEKITYDNNYFMYKVVPRTKGIPDKIVIDIDPVYTTDVRYAKLAEMVIEDYKAKHNGETISVSATNLRSKLSDPNYDQEIFFEDTPLGKAAFDIPTEDIILLLEDVFISNGYSVEKLNFDKTVEVTYKRMGSRVHSKQTPPIEEEREETNKVDDNSTNSYNSFLEWLKMDEELKQDFIEDDGILIPAKKVDEKTLLEEFDESSNDKQDAIDELSEYKSILETYRQDESIEEESSLEENTKEDIPEEYNFSEVYQEIDGKTKTPLSQRIRRKFFDMRGKLDFLIGNVLAGCIGVLAYELANDINISKLDPEQARNYVEKTIIKIAQWDPLYRELSKVVDVDQLKAVLAGGVVATLASMGIKWLQNTNEKLNEEIKAKKQQKESFQQQLINRKGGR